MQNRMLRIRLRVLILILPSFLSISGCTTTNSTQSNQEAIKTGSSVKQVDPPEISILTDSQRRGYVRSNCTSGTLDYSTTFGNWRRAKDCNIKIDETNPHLKISSILLDSSGDITGIQLVTADGDTATELNSKYNTVTEAPSGKSCVKFGAGIIPTLFVVNKELCEALHYQQV